MQLTAPLQERWEWLAPAINDWKLIFPQHSKARTTDFQQKWVNWGFNIESALRVELGWTDTSLLLRRHNTLAKEVAELQLLARKTVVWDAIFVAVLATLALATAILTSLREPLFAASSIISGIAVLEVGYRFRSRGVLTETIAVVLCIGGITVGATAAAAGMDVYGTPFKPTLDGFAFGAVFWGFVIAFPRRLVAKLSSNAIRDAERKTPIVSILLEMKYVIDWLSGPLDSFFDRDGRRTAASAFVRCSNLTERSLLAYIDPPSTVLRLQVAERLRKTSLALHSYGAWVLMPNSATRDELRRRSLSIFAAVELQELDMLPVEELSEKTKADRVKVALDYIKRLLVMLTLPIAVLLAYRMNLLKDNTTFSYAVLASVFWVAINVGHLLDAQFSGKVTALKDLSTVFNASSTSAPKK